LPFVARWTGNLSAREELPLTRDIGGFVQAKVIYVGDRLGEFTQSPDRTDLPSYTQTDLSLGIHNNDDYSISVYMNNITDQRGLLYGGLGGGSGAEFAVFSRVRWHHGKEGLSRSAVATRDGVVTKGGKRNLKIRRPSKFYRQYVLIVLLLCYAFNFMDRWVLSVSLDSIKRDLRLTDSEIGLLTG